MSQDPRKEKFNDPKSIYYQHRSLMKGTFTHAAPGYKVDDTDSQNHSASNRQRVNMDSTMSSETKSIYYHFISLKKLLTTDELQQLKPLEDTLKAQGKLVPPFGQCYYCKETTHWASDCLKLKLAREQPDGKPAHGQCFKCGSFDHWASKCPQKDETKPEKISTSTESTAVVEKTNKRKRMCDEDVAEPTPSKQRKVEKTAEPKKTKRRIPKRKYCFICKSETHDAKNCDEIVLDPEEELKKSLSKLTLN